MGLFFCYQAVGLKRHLPVSTLVERISHRSFGFTGGSSPRTAGANSGSSHHRAIRPHARALS